MTLSAYDPIRNLVCKWSWKVKPNEQLLTGIASRDKSLFVRLLDFYGISGVKPFPALPAGNLSFLDAIPPMGTKLAFNVDANTSKLGPNSELTKISGTIKRTVYFYFGLPKTNTSPQLYTAPIKDELFYINPLDHAIIQNCVISFTDLRYLPF